MKSIFTHSYRLMSVSIALLSILSVYAFELSTYADQSKLAEGHWVKISIPESGVYKVTKAQLTQWGFKDPSKVTVHGYGGNRISDKLLAENYIDDLPTVASVNTGDGIVFYGVGPETWVASQNTYYRQNRNIYTDAGYYFLTDRDDFAQIEVPAQGTAQVSNPETTFYDRLHHELDLTSPGEAGYILVGESFKNQNDRKFTFQAPGRVEGSVAWLECGIVIKSFVTSKATFQVNGQKLSETITDKLPAIANSAYLHGDYATTNHTFTEGGNEIEIKISVANATSTQNVWLDYLAVNYLRELALNDKGYLNFWSAASALRLATGAKSNVTVWDVTDPLDIKALNMSKGNGTVQWGNDYTGMRSYTAWSDDATLPQPTFVSNVSNQNIHAMENQEMLIFTLPEYKAQAERIAQLHRNNDDMKVEVLNVEDIYNEFASGSPDVAALRKCLKMFYDRSLNDPNPLRYALLLGRTTYDNRHLTSQFSGASAHNTIPYYMGGILKSQLSDNTAYGTDDVIAMLEDASGGNLGLDNLCVAVGRMPVTSVSEAKNIVDKLYQYVEESQKGTWKNNFLFLADDGDNGIHAQQTENAIGELMATPDGQNFVTKVYVDAYDIVGGICEGGRSDMYRLLDEGVVWWNFSGHANNHSWTGEGMLTYTDINNMYLKRLPIVMAATCDFLRWDSNTISGGEIMFHERNGGAIALISATRPVYISDNGLFTKAIGRAISKRDDSGELPRLGDIYRNAKNNILNDNGEHRSNPNRLRYVLMGDPAMKLPTPSNIVKLETIDGEVVNADNQVTLKALQQAELKGSICTPQGETITDFNGTIQVNIYDAERSITTLGVRDENIKLTYEQHGDKLYGGSTVVTDGKFTLKVAMPGEVADNFRPASINMYACSTDGKKEAIGVNREFYVYGYDETVEADTQAPQIESMVLNHSSFEDGDAVNESPMMIATVSDNIGINLSAAGIGHQMVLTLDGKRTYTDVSMFYTPSADGSPSGEIRYPLSDLTNGEHSLQLKVWDTAANSATKQISFTVDKNEVPTIFKVYTDVNPASTEVRFYVNHNRPDAELTVSITVYDMLGHALWETTSKGPSDMFTSAPITWDLCDTSGRRLPRGIYLYRATISTNNGDTYDSATRRLAITAQ